MSLLDPPAELREPAAGCRNLSTWPVLAGTPPARDTMLSSPIILYDYPEIAPESAGDLFDGTEIDEILVAADHDPERRREARDRASRTSGRACCSSAPSRSPRSSSMSLHGVMRPGGRGRRASERGGSADACPAQGARVRLRPRAGGDVFDLVLIGKAATVESVRAGPGRDLPDLGGARRGSRRAPRHDAPARTSLLLRARGARAPAGRRPGGRPPPPRSWSPASATSSSATTDSASRWPSASRPAPCQPRSRSATTASAATTWPMR